MAGVNDVVFRQLCIENGAQLTYTEMVSSKGLSYSNSRTESLLETAPSENKVAVQLFGHEPDVMASEASRISEKMFDKLAYLDINMGCPVRKLVKKGEGSALMKNHKLAFDIASACVKSSHVPVTVKFRRGYNNNDETCVEFAKVMEQAGVSAVCVHGRYATQFYHGECCWEAIGRVVDAVNIPVIGSGDIVDKSSFDRALKHGVDAIMIGRGAQGNPWVFDNILKNTNPPTYKDKINMAKRHVHDYFDYYGGHLTPMRKHCSWYVRGIPGASIARDALNKCVTVDDYDKVFEALLHSIDKRGFY